MTEPLIGAAAAAAAKGAAGKLGKKGAGLAGEAGAKWALAHIPGLIARFRNRDVAFIENVETINSAKEVSKNAEFVRFKRFTNDPSRRVLLRLGIVMRAYAKDAERVQEERQRIIRRNGLPGLHLVEAMQAGLLSLIHDALEKGGLNEAELKENMAEVIEDIDHFVSFVQGATQADQEATIIATLIRRSYPRVFVIAGSGTAVKSTSEVASKVAKLVGGYVVQRHDEGPRVAFVYRIAT